MKSENKKNYLVYFENTEVKLFSYQIAYSLAELTGGTVLIILN